MKRLLSDALAIAAGALMVGTVAAPAAQAEPDIHVTCAETKITFPWQDVWYVLGSRCSGAPVDSEDRGTITFKDTGETWECENVAVFEESDGVRDASGSDCRLVEEPERF